MSSSLLGFNTEIVILKLTFVHNHHVIVNTYLPAPFPGSELLLAVTKGTGSFPFAPFEALLCSDIKCCDKCNRFKVRTNVDIIKGRKTRLFSVFEFNIAGLIVFHKYGNIFNIFDRDFNRLAIRVAVGIECSSR